MYRWDESHGSSDSTGRTTRASESSTSPSESLTSGPEHDSGHPYSVSEATEPPKILDEEDEEQGSSSPDGEQRRDTVPSLADERVAVRAESEAGSFCFSGCPSERLPEEHIELELPDDNSHPIPLLYSKPESTLQHTVMGFPGSALGFNYMTDFQAHELNILGEIAPYVHEDGRMWILTSGGKSFTPTGTVDVEFRFMTTGRKIKLSFYVIPLKLEKALVLGEPFSRMMSKCERQGRTGFS